jgi:exonuclease VII large subunit
MRNLEMDAHEDQPDPTSAPVVVSANAPPPTPEISDAHEMLLKDLDAVRQAAQLVTDRIEALDKRLESREASLVKQEQMLERAARETLSEAGREWAQTAERYRKLADELGALCGHQHQQVMRIADPWRTLAATICGGLLAGFVVAWMMSRGGDGLREWLGGSQPPATVAAPQNDQQAPAKAKGAKAGVR